MAKAMSHIKTWTKRTDYFILVYFLQGSFQFSIILLYNYNKISLHYKANNFACKFTLLILINEIRLPISLVILVLILISL